MRSGSGRYRPHGGGSAFALRNIATERATTLVASRALVFATADGTTVRQLAPREAAALMGLPATMALPDTVRDATAVLGNGIEAHTARAIVVAAREALAEAGARTDGSDDDLTAAAREAVDAAVAGAVEAHVAWWRARTRKRRLVVEQWMLEATDQVDDLPGQRGKHSRHGVHRLPRRVTRGSGFRPTDSEAHGARPRRAASV